MQSGELRNRDTMDSKRQTTSNNGRRQPTHYVDDSPLCCCEYINSEGERSHLFGLCCDCEAMDKTVDNFVFGRQVEDHSVAEVISVVEDRLRVPCRGGAVRVNLAIVTPALSLTFLLWLSSLHYYLLFAVFLSGFPLYFCLAMRLVFKHRPQTKMFLYWSYSSAVYLIYLYEVKLVGLFWDLPKIVSFWENLTLVCGAVLSFVTYKVVKNRAENLMDAVDGRMCSICQHLVVCKDHHCVWLDVCISSINKNFFLLFLLLTSLTATHLGLMLTSAACPGELIGPIVLPRICWPYSDLDRQLLSGGLYSLSVAVLLCLLLGEQLTRKLRRGDILYL